MSKTGKAIIWLIVLIVVVWAGYAVLRNGEQGSGNAAADSGTGPIRIGVLQTLTGDAASYGTSQERALEIAIAEINAAGGINGRQVEAVTEDDKCDPQTGGVAAQKLVNVDKVLVIIGGTCSGSTLAAATVTEPAKVVLVSGSASSPKVTSAGDYLFRTYPSDSLAGKVAAKYDYEKLGAKKAALITELTDYAQGLRGSYKEGFQALGGQIVADETFNTGDVDFRTQVAKIKAAGPDVVYMVPQSVTPAAAIMKQLRESGLKAPVQSSEIVLDPQAIKDNKTALEGVYGVQPAVDYKNNPKAKAFADAHQQKFNGQPGIFAGNAYDALYLVRDAIAANGGKVDTAKLRDFLYAVKDWEGVTGRITMDKNGDPIVGVDVWQVKGGQAADLGPYSP